MCTARFLSGPVCHPDAAGTGSGHSPYCGNIPAQEGEGGEIVIAYKGAEQQDQYHKKQKNTETQRMRV